MAQAAGMLGQLGSGKGLKTAKNKEQSPSKALGCLGRGDRVGRGKFGGRGLGRGNVQHSGEEEQTVSQLLQCHDNV